MRLEGNVKALREEIEKLSSRILRSRRTLTSEALRSDRGLLLSSPCPSDSDSDGSDAPEVRRAELEVNREHASSAASDVALDSACLPHDLEEGQ